MGTTIPSYTVFCPFRFLRLTTFFLPPHAASDPDSASAFSIKRYSSVKSFFPDGTWSHGAITLNPLNPDYSPIEIPSDSADSFRIVARFIRLL